MRISYLAACGLALATVSAAHPAKPQSADASNAVAPAVRAPAEVVDAFHAALGRGDTQAAAALIADDALIFESGGAERTKAEYAAHHLPADAEFSKSVQAAVTRRAGHADGDFAWIASEGRTTGAIKGKTLDLRTTETMVLRREGEAWKIVHIHWSSAAKR